MKAKVDTSNIEALVVELSVNPFDAKLNYAVANEYLRLNQTASAVSFFLRAAEYAEDDTDTAYASLIKTAKCIENQNDRALTVSNCLLQAIAVCSTRPEAYFLMSQFYERSGNWQECYTWAKMGYNYVGKTQNHLPKDLSLGYYGSYCFLFEIAISSWWIGRAEDSKRMLTELSKTKGMHPIYEKAVERNLKRLS
ncbi:hypothetical protein UFOVP965_20 [uncultured Caudovirales phage]|uniref:Tetratricopeptide repeat protein n=1 Tax=uncultured Caudovirales phage TaxID=2100421 RepID=A0A6J5PVH6_9CAUD|nr:hypothetical protein UFOVP965_20 [uncultured Caudovirales phage]CAB4179719.1 hypothetical protein UFOVP1035_16 [uncultured Caudovirales phage]CAB4188835.1 hypothetical protein UFOVP1181_122 [uncultured Caudovirales phage]